MSNLLIYLMIKYNSWNKNNFCPQINISSGFGQLLYFCLSPTYFELWLWWGPATAMPDNKIFWVCSNISVIVYRHMPMQLLMRIAGWVMVWAIRGCIPLRGQSQTIPWEPLSKITPSIPRQLFQNIWSCRLALMCLLSHKGLSGLVRLYWSVSWYSKFNPESKCSWALVWFLFKEFTESQACIDRLRQP